MENEENQLEETVGEMRRQHEMMADGKRYIIFYTFGNEHQNSAGEISASISVENEVKENV